LLTGAAHYECTNAYSVVQTYDPYPAWNQYPLLQEQEQSGLGKKAMLQCGEQVYQIHIPFIKKLRAD
jgi:hypothetical protein